jgi:nucleotide-binding universal stress UspA family protein
METSYKILTPTDLSELSCVGLRRAFEMGRSQKAEVMVYHVIEVGDQWTMKREESGPVRDMLEHHRLLLERFLRDRLPDEMNLAEVRQIVEFGGAAQNIVEKAEREGVD